MIVTYRKWAAALVALIVAVAPFSPVAANVATGAGAPSGAARVFGNVAFKIAVPQKRKPSDTLSAFRVRPHYVSSETKSVQILTDGRNPVNIDVQQCSSVCSVKFQVVAGTHVFGVKTFDLPGSRGNILSLNSTGPVVVNAVGITFVRLTLEGIVQNVGLELAEPVPAAGVPANIALTVNVQDADRQIIIGPARFYNAPVVLTTTDPANGALSKTLLSSPSDAQGVTVKYSGARVGNITFSARASGLTGVVTSAVLFLQPVPSTHKLFAGDSGIKNLRVYSTLPGNPFLGAIGGYHDVFEETAAVDPAAGKLYVSQDPNVVDGGNVEVRSTAGGFPLLTNITGLNFPLAVAVDPAAGRLFVLEALGDVKVFSTAGGYPLVNTIGGLANAVSLAADPVAGKLYVSQYPLNVPSVVKVFSTHAGNALLATIGGLAYVARVAVDPATGRLYVMENNFQTAVGDVKVYGSASGYTLLATLGGFYSPTAIAVDPNAHKLYVAEEGLHTMWSAEVKVFGTTQGYPLLEKFGNMPWSFNSMTVSP